MRALRRGLPLAALLTAAGLAGPAAAPLGHPSVAADGIGPLRLGLTLAEAAAGARALDPATLVGPGCDGREMVSLALPTASSAPLQAMAMADAAGRIEEVRLQPAAASRGETEQSCRARLRHFAAALLPPEAATETHRHPGFREFRLPLRGAVALGRWFPAGGSCDLAVTFGRPAALPEG